MLLELGKHKIEGDSADLVYTHLSSKEYARLSEKDGQFIPQFRLIKDGKELDADISTMVKGIAETEMGKRLATGTKIGGTGDNHSSRTDKGGDRPATREMLAMRGDDSYDNAGK